MPVDLVKKTGTGTLLTATPAEVAEVYESVNDVNRFKDEDVTKLNECKRTVFLTQTEYDAIATKDADIWYVIRPEI